MIGHVQERKTAPGLSEQQTDRRCRALSLLLVVAFCSQTFSFFKFFYLFCICSSFAPKSSQFPQIKERVARGVLVGSATARESPRAHFSTLDSARRRRGGAWIQPVAFYTFTQVRGVFQAVLHKETPLSPHAGSLV